MRWLSWLAVSALTLALAPTALAVPVTFTAHLTGPNENPPNASPGVGDATVTFDVDAHTMVVSATFSGLTSGTMAAHIHCCVSPPGTAGVATQTPSFAGFPLGVTSGTYSPTTFDMTLASSYNPAFITANGSIAAAELALFNGALNGMAYFNIHTTNFPSGEIRGFLTQVPEPATLAMFGLGLVGLYMVRRRIQS